MLKTSTITTEEFAFLEEGHENLVCLECGEVFEKPVLASVFLEGALTTYYACPRCLSKVEAVNPSKHGEKSRSSEETKDPEIDMQEEAQCKHFLGYLKKRSKNTPIPDECLICDRMIQCLM